MRSIAMMILVGAMTACGPATSETANETASQTTGQTAGQMAGDQAEIGHVLDQLHELAAKADGDKYFALFAPDAIYIGTEASERWTLAQFKDYALSRFSKGAGWVYHPRERHIVIGPGGDIAWFDELLESEKYGTSRGTGVLVRAGAGWKIIQYSLCFPIPNPLTVDVTRKIMDFEGK